MEKFRAALTEDGAMDDALADKFAEAFKEARAATVASGDAAKGVDAAVAKVTAATKQHVNMVDREWDKAVDKAVGEAKKSALNRPLSLLEIGTNYMKEGRYQEALDAFTHLTKIEPNNALYILQRGAALIGIGEIPKGTADIEFAATLEPAYQQFAAHARALRDIYQRTGYVPSSQNISGATIALSPEDRARIVRHILDPKSVK